MIAGLLAIWLTNDDGEPWEFDRGDQGDAWVGLDMGDYATDIQSYRIPKTETLRAIYGYPEFTNALSITFLDDTYIIELPEQAEEDYLKHIKQLPGCFMHHPSPDLRYFNGRRGQLEYSTGTHRLKQPQPATVDGQCDDTDYAAERGCFYPGSIISSIVDGVPSSVSAGILLQKGNERRLTVAIHGWQHELELAKPLEDCKRPADRSSQSEAEAPTEQAPSIEQKAVVKQEGSQESQSQLQAQIRLGDPQHFRIRQGDTRTSTDVGYVTERLGNTDIGLAILDNENVTFRNEFLELPSVPKVLLYSDELVYKSQWAIDSYTTGLQAPFHSQGKKMIRERSRGGHFVNNPDIQPGKYLEIIQGIFYTGETRISTPPVIREGVCGSVVVRLHQAEVISKTERTIASRTTKNPGNEESKTVMPAEQRDVSSPRPSSEMAGPTEGSPGYPLTNISSKRDDQVPLYHKGEIGGFMHWADLQKKGHYRKQFFCYADCTDPLIEAGWSVAVTQPSPKRKRNSTEKINDPFSD
ncbi:hypothetical protein B0O99DRAFT_615428 [Bisporella sp. PMI_857]|nr:hypothetical protein B0O99DRAFT_615428 [Bisporella sp. PMI_857]